MYQAGVEEQVIQQFTGHASEVVRKYKKTDDNLLKQANKTLAGTEFVKLVKCPISATVSKVPDLEDPDVTKVKFEPACSPPCSKVVTKSVCQFYQNSECKDMCHVLHQLDKKIDQKKLKKLKLSLKYSKGKKD